MPLVVGVIEVVFEFVGWPVAPEETENERAWRLLSVQRSSSFVVGFVKQISFQNFPLFWVLLNQMDCLLGQPVLVVVEC